MTKGDLIDLLVLHFEISKAEARQILDALGQWWTDELRGGCDTLIPGIGKIGIKYFEPRMRTNPRTGAPVSVPGQCRPKLRPSRKLMRMLNPPAEEPRRMVGADRVVDPMPRAPELA